MSRPEPAAIATLAEPVIKPVFFAWLDIVGDPVRANTSGANATPTGTGDPDLDGQEFTGIDGTFVRVSPVKFKQGGSDTVTAEISGLPDLDAETLALIEDPANWRGREARLWRVIRNAVNQQQGGYHSYYTGKMTALTHSGDGDAQVIRVSIEGYLGSLSQASNRTYLDQSRYDPGDESARAAIAIANGDYGGAASSGGYGGVGGGGSTGGAIDFRRNSKK